MRPLNFFTPSPEFVARMATKCAGRIVIDAGCGYGNTTAALLAGGVSAVGIDLQEDKVLAGMQTYPEAAGKLLAGDVIGHPRLSTGHPTTVLFARPCHGPWVANTVRTLTNQQVIYISEPGSEEGDLEGLCYKRLFSDIPVGGEEEVAWEVQQPSPDYGNVHRWCLITTRPTDTHKGDTVWVRDGGSKWYWNDGPAYMPKKGEQVLQHAMTNDMDWLDHTLTTDWQRWNERVNDTTLKDGWVSPEGRWYRCGYFEHDKVAYDYLRKTTTQLEEAGWARVSHSDKRVVLRRSWRDEGRLTREQLATLQANGVDMPEYLVETAER